MFAGGASAPRMIANTISSLVMHCQTPYCQRVLIAPKQPPKSDLHQCDGVMETVVAAPIAVATAG
ncbi:hypothetical protein ACFQ0M_08565 [Kitasatospora aburaviensis]